ncbi:amino acid/polyamine/organocation transporter, APC superfamily [Salinimicrobium catena]|uniref:Amino acid/polyamine/organocation transporter, APC superfamily n=1 Tax=Salinimicrobium catena TaxID=390640 RepID=A0A1H5LSP5_9FLAO|nr:APC family permease [Salinimicrobium catena]SDL13777.1 basic amino acid/polyamine antiporter, APA family [Salinimicrobium catena]SEE80004.1 amino acid/polyamine/organocation transporter, APC superfamily [Salinimicrobium catena]
MGGKELKRSLGFWDVLMFGVGGIVGAGIYAIIGQAAGLSGNMLWLSFVVAATVALLTGLSYAEFVSRFPDSGGSFEYIKQGLGPKTALFMSIFMAFTGIVAAAAISISFADYLSRLVNFPSWIIIIAIIVFMAFFNIIGAKYSSYYNSFATVVTLIGLAAVIVVSVPDWGSVSLVKLNEKSWTGVLAGGALIFFSYIGFEDLVKMAEETKKPKKNMPKAILLSGIIVLIIYVLIAISAVSVMGWEELSNSNGPLAAVIETKLGKIGATALVIIALFATSKTILSNILGTSRLLYDVSRDSNIKWLSKFTTISGIGNAPNYAIIAISIVAIAFGLIGNLKIVASISNIFIFIVFGMVNAALLRYRYKNRDEEDKAPFHVWGNINNIPIPTVVALLTILVLFGYNIYNLFQGNV